MRLIIFLILLQVGLCLEFSVYAQYQPAQIDSLISELPVLSDTVKIKTLLEIARFYKFSNADTALYFASQAEAEAVRLSLQKWHVLSLSSMGIINYGKGDYPEALKYMKRLIPIQTQMGDSLSLAKTLNNIGSVNAKIGNWETSADYFMAALRIKELQNVPKASLSMAYINLGNIYSDISNYEQAAVYYKNAIDISEEVKDSVGMGLVYGNLARLYSKMGRYADARPLFLKSIEIERSKGNLKDLAGNLNSLGTLCTHQGKYDSAIYFYDQAIAMADEVGSSYEMLNGQKEKASVLLKKDQARAAYELASQVWEKLQTMEAKELKKDILQILSESAELMGRTDDALQYFKSYSILRDSLLNETNTRNINELKWKYEDEKSDLFIAQLKKENQAEQRRKVLAYTLLGISILLIVLLVLLLILRNKLLRQKEKAMQTQKEMQKMQLDLKQQELSALSTNLLQKSDALIKVKEKISTTKGANKEVVNLIDQTIKLDDDWNQFKIHFEQVHHGFFEKLQENYPRLTPNEHRICAYLRLNLSSKEIAQLHNVSLSAIDKSRNRLRKKLDLDPQQNLVTFIQSI